jgi:lysophospholipase L1-like esterase
MCSILKTRVYRIIIFSGVWMSLSCSSTSVREARPTSIVEFNGNLHELAKKHSVDTLDTYSIFLDSNAIPNPVYYSNDGLHLSREGYRNWVERALRPYLAHCSCTRIAMVGNSLTELIEDFDFGNSGTVSNWEFLLNTPTINSGVSGSTSEDILYRLDDILATDADCYFLMVGINDILHGYPHQKSLANIDVILRRLTESHAKVILQDIIPRY